MFYKRKRLRQLHPRFFSCPSVCPNDDKKAFSADRIKFCDECDLKLADDKFKESVEKIWFERLASKANRFKFEKVLATLYRTLALEDLPADKMSVKTRILLDCYHSEISKGEQIEEYNSRQPDI